MIRPVQCGVYKIRYLQTGREYIGASQNMWRRGKAHGGMLRRGEHKNAALQRDANAGHKMRFEVLLVCAPKDMLMYERLIMAATKRCYNIRPSQTPEHIATLTRVRRAKAKLTDAQVAAIRADTRPQRVVAAEHGVSQAYVSDICTRKLRK